MESSSRIVVLGEGNWPVWRLQISIILKARKLYEVVTSKRPVTDNRKALEEWDDLDRKAQEVIVLRVEESILSYLTTCTSSNEMWEKLQNIFESKSKVGLHLIQQRFYNLQIEAPMTKFISTVEEIVSTLKSFNEEISEKMVVTKILLSLPDTYKHFISAWESVRVEEQTLSNLTIRLIVEEERHKASEVESSAALLTKHGSARSGFRKYKNKSESDGANLSASGKCFERGKPGHFKRDCRNRKCNFCGKLGHTYSNCRARQSHKPNNAYIMQGDFTNRWVMDTGASEHMCFNREYFTDFIEVDNKFVTVGNGNKLRVVGICTYTSIQWI
ncbi:unnamed protein product [Euphydryas editha]|uniref:CCHC-type domain-containing protein n=1 Tax=Euphydryas editha TaxID=104508 RepID=A0AAU9TTQ4_EUPED|nr:unnamed protein product [Euphydryas editha]